MKRLLVFSLLILSFGSLFAQKPRIKNDSGYDEHRFHFGFALGLNIMDFAFQRPPINTENRLYADVSSVQPGFQVNVVTDFRLGNYLNLRIIPGINLGQRTISFKNYGVSEPSPDIVFRDKMTLESNFVDIPILLKYKAMRINNFRPYIIGGFSVKYDWAARKGYDDNAGVFIRLKPFDFYYEFGVGLDQYLPYFKFTTELRVAIGLNDILVKKPSEAEGAAKYPKSINRLSSRLVTLNFYFE